MGYIFKELFLKLAIFLGKSRPEMPSAKAKKIHMVEIHFGPQKYNLFPGLIPTSNDKEMH